MSDAINQNLGFNKSIETVSIELPPERDVIIYNDDFTSMQFVVDILVSIFNFEQEAAKETMYKIHQQGSAVVGTYTYDIAMSRAKYAVDFAKKNGFPLRVEVE